MDNSQKTQIDKLMELKQLYEQGILTQEEMENEKAKILNTAAPEEESINRNASPNDAIKSSTSSPNDNNRRNHKVILGIAGVIVLAIVVVIGFFLNKQSEPKEAITNDIEVPQITDGDPYVDCIKIKDLFEIIRKDDSNELRTLLTNIGFKPNGKDEEYSSAIWSKVYGLSAESDTVFIQLDKIRALIYLNVWCTKDAIMDKWISEIKELGYTFVDSSTEGDDKTLSFDKSNGASGLIQFTPSPKMNRLNVITNFGSIIENEGNSDDVRVRDDDYLYTFVGKIEGSATQYSFKMAINITDEGKATGYYIVTNGANERVILEGTVTDWADKHEGEISLYEFDEAKNEYTGYYFQGNLTIEYSQSGAFAGYSIDGTYKNGSNINWPFSAVNI